MPHAHPTQLSVLQLVGITYFAVAGGPYGFEDVVGAGGGRLTLLFLFLCPFIWSGPIALLTAELASMMPEMGGHIIWVNRGMGPYFGFLNAALALMNNAFDNAMYPVMFVDYTSELLSDVDGEVDEGFGFVLSMSIKFVLCVGVMWANVRGVAVVGDSSVLTASGAIAPFIVMVVGAAAGMGKRKRDMFNPPAASGPVDWARFLSVMFWNTSGFDSAGACAGEVSDPGRTYPRALSITIVLVILTYAAPTLVGLAYVPDVSTWEDGTWVDVAEMVGGEWLAVWMAFGGAISSLGLLVTLTATSSRVMAGMGSTGALPKAVASRHPKYETPHIAILLTSCITLSLSPLDFSSLAEVGMLFYVVSTILKFISLVRLRDVEPDTPRPFRIGLGTSWLAVASFPPVLCCVCTMAACSWRSLAIFGGTMAVSTFFYAARTGWRFRLDANLVDDEEEEEDVQDAPAAAAGRAVRAGTPGLGGVGGGGVGRPLGGTPLGVSEGNPWWGEETTVVPSISATILARADDPGGGWLGSLVESEWASSWLGTRGRHDDVSSRGSGPAGDGDTDVGGDSDTETAHGGDGGDGVDHGGDGGGRRGGGGGGGRGRRGAGPPPPSPLGPTGLISGHALAEEFRLEEE